MAKMADPDGGSPAPAGIDLGRAGNDPVKFGLPRTRGDRPFRINSMGGQKRAPPHPRG